MNCRSQFVSKDEIRIVGSGGTEFVITKAQVKVIYAAQTGSAAARKAATVTIIRQQIVDFFGAAACDPLTIGIDFNPTDDNAIMSCDHNG